MLLLLYIGVWGRFYIPVGCRGGQQAPPLESSSPPGVPGFPMCYSVVFLKGPRISHFGNLLLFTQL